MNQIIIFFYSHLYILNLALSIDFIIFIYCIFITHPNFLLCLRLKDAWGLFEVILFFWDWQLLVFLVSTHLLIDQYQAKPY